MISITMGYQTGRGKFKNFFTKKAVIAAVLLAISGSYLGIQIWNIENEPRTIVKAAFNSEDVFETVSVNRKWILIGDEFTFKQRSLTFSAELSHEFTAAAGSAISLNYLISETETGEKMDRGEGNRFSADIFVGNLKPGQYTVEARVESPNGGFTSSGVGFVVSYPLYVTWTLDWEGYDIPQTYLNDLVEISQKHGMPITHFFNPRLYTSPDISRPRAQYLTEWVKERRDKNGDAIGLHLHMFPDLVSAAGVNPRTSPNWGSWKTDGYDIITSAYTYDETGRMLEWSKNIFEKNGLGIPTMFRAGGWFADEETLQALNDAGFELDSSGRTKYTFGENKVTGPWELSAATRPYRLNSNDQNIVDSPTIDLWEFPDNGADSWAYSAEQLIARFKANFTGEPISDKQIVTYLSHPEWFSKDKPKIEILFQELERFRNSTDRGPVIYITLDQAYQIWAGR